MSDIDSPPLTVIVTSDELAAAAELWPPGFPPTWLGPDPTASTAAGVRSLVARGWVEEDGLPAEPLASLLAVVWSADRRLEVRYSTEDGSVVRSIHIGDEFGVGHVGRENGVHGITEVDAATWNDALAGVILDPLVDEEEPWPETGEAPTLDELIERATGSTVASVATRDGHDRRVASVVIAWADGPWLIQPETSVVVRATPTLIAERLADTIAYDPGEETGYR